MGKFISNYDELPVQNKNIYDLVQEKSDGNVSVFADTIGVKRQVLERIFKKDKRNGKYPSVSENIKEGIKKKFNVDELQLLSNVKNVDTNNEQKSEEVNEINTLPEGINLKDPTVSYLLNVINALADQGKMNAEANKMNAEANQKHASANEQNSLTIGKMVDILEKMLLKEKAV